MILQSDTETPTQDAPRRRIDLPDAMKIAHEGLCAYFATLAFGEMPDAARSILFLEDYFARRRIVVRSDPPEGACPEDPDDFLAGHHALALLVMKQEYELRRSTDLSELDAIELIVEQH